MLHVQSLPVPSDTYYESVREILCSALEAVQAKYGAVSLISAEIDSIESYVSYRSLPGRGELNVQHAGARASLRLLPKQ